MDTRVRTGTKTGSIDHEFDIEQGAAGVAVVLSTYHKVDRTGKLTIPCVTKVAVRLVAKTLSGENIQLKQRTREVANTVSGEHVQSHSANTLSGQLIQEHWHW